MLCFRHFSTSLHTFHCLWMLVALSPIAKNSHQAHPLRCCFAAAIAQVLCTRLPSSNGGGDEMVIAFRGTETKGMGASSDILTDLFALQTYIGEMKGVPVDRHPKEIKVGGGSSTTSGVYVEMRKGEARHSNSDKGMHDLLSGTTLQLFASGRFSGDCEGPITARSFSGCQAGQ